MSLLESVARKGLLLQRLTYWDEQHAAASASGDADCALAACFFQNRLDHVAKDSAFFPPPCVVSRVSSTFLQSDSTWPACRFERASAYHKPQNVQYCHKVCQGEVLSDVGLGEKERKVAKAQIIIRQQF
jgi:hypothetical protein